MKQLLFLLAIGGSIVMASCVSKQKYMDSQDQLSNCTKERKALQTKVLNLENTVNEISRINKDEYCIMLLI